MARKAKWKKAQVADLARAIHARRPRRVAFAERKGCTFMAELAALTAKGLKGNALREAIQGIKTFSWAFAVDAIYDSAEHYEGAALVECQVYWASRLHYLGPNHREKMERLVRERGATIVAEAWPYVAAWFDEHHPRPRAFLRAMRGTAIA